MTLSEIISTAIEPAYALLPDRMRSDEANVMMLAIGLQESRFMHRKQIGGPARGFWQFERGGGVAGVLRHHASKGFALKVCDARGVAPVAEQVYQRLEFDDVLSAAFARLLLFTDPHALPKIGECAKAWDYYERNWRPGKPHRKTWDALYAQALEQVTQ